MNPITMHVTLCESNNTIWMCVCRCTVPPGGYGLLYSGCFVHVSVMSQIVTYLGDVMHTISSLELYHIL